MSIILRDGSTVLDRRLDALPEEDERNEEFPVCLALAGLDRLRSYTWGSSTYLDQGEEGACVWFGISHELAARPKRVVGLTPELARERYFETQRRDPWEGGEYPGAQPRYGGTSLQTGIALAKALGYYSGYLWTQQEREVALAVGYRGPVLIAVDWHEGMWEPDAEGYIRPQGDVVGRHCTLLRGYNHARGDYLVHNSWGTDWGRGGTARIRRDDLEQLLNRRYAQACLPQGRRALDTQAVRPA